MLTTQEIIDLNLLIQGDRPPNDGMEKHFLRCINGKSSPCSAKEKEWFKFWSCANNKKQHNASPALEIAQPSDCIEFCKIVAAPQNANQNAVNMQDLSIDDEEIQIDGENIVRWAEVADSEDLSLLAGAQYSDINDVFIIRSAQNSGLSFVKENSSSELIRPIRSFKSGTFFFSGAKGERINKLICNSLSPFEKRVIDANNYLSAHGFHVSELGGNASSLTLADAILDFEEHKKVPDGDKWDDIHALLVEKPVATQRCGAKFISAWIHHVETESGEGFDVYKRVLLATLLRHSGQLEQSLEISKVVDISGRKLMGNNMSISVLCNVRAATLMDVATLQPNKRAYWLKLARITLNKANAMSGCDGIEVLTSYQRLNMLEKQG